VEAIDVECRSGFLNLALLQCLIFL